MKSTGTGSAGGPALPAGACSAASTQVTTGDSEAADLEGEAQLHKIGLLCRNAPVTFWVTAINASLLAYVNADTHTGTVPALLWWCTLIASAVLRWGLVRRFVNGTARPEPWLRLYVSGTAAAAVVWGAGAVLFTWHAADGARLFTGLVLAGMTAGAVPVLGPVPMAFRAFALPVAIPLATAILWQAASPLHWAFGLMVLIFLAAVLTSAHSLHRSLDAAIRLGLEQRTMAARLQRARDAAEAALVERMRLDAARRASEQRYRLLLQLSPAGIFHFDSRLVITFCNERFAQIVGATREGLVGLDMNTLRDPRILPTLRAAIEGREHHYEGGYLSTLSAAQLCISISCTPFRDEDGLHDGGIAIVQDVSERYRSEEEIRRLAYFDPLTGLPNRRLLMDRLGRAIAACSRKSETGALLILDLDHFKSINDTQGHDVGDRLLVELARRFERSLRKVDTVSRLGGDEFVILAEDLGASPHAAAASAVAIAEKLRALCEEPFALGGSEAEYFTSASIGVTLFGSEDQSCEAVLKQADVALYQAKGDGRNAARFFNPSMQAAVEQRAALLFALRRGLERQEFRLYYQPQVDRDGELIGVEALVRWFPPGQGMISPAQFVPLAEESGLILPLGRWVLEAACAQLAAWSRHPDLRNVRISVNVSARQFHQGDFVEQVRETLAAHRVDPAMLQLELTEGVVLEQVETVIGRMQALNAMGVHFALDDFGKGYSSLSYLKRLPLRHLKVDRSFVCDIPEDANGCSIVRAILSLGTSLGLQVIAEGVETDAQRAYLHDHGCDAYQGYLFGRPEPVEAFERFATRYRGQGLAVDGDACPPPLLQ